VIAISSADLPLRIGLEGRLYVLELDAVGELCLREARD
jgi:hypothetical protein